MIINKKYLIGQELIQRKIITQEQLDAGIQYQEENKVRLGEALMALGHIQEDDLLVVLADQLGIEHICFSGLDIPQDILQLVPEEVVRTHMICPVKCKGDDVVIAVADPLNINLLLEVQKKIGKKVVPAIASASGIKSAIELFYK